MLNPFAASALVIAALGVLFAAARAARLSGRVSPEWSRKIVHVGMGTVCLTFPWVFSNNAPVLVIAGCAAVGLLLLRLVPTARTAFGCVLHGVERKSYGEFAFVAGVASTFVLAHGNALAYVVPVAILTFADALAALIGARYGELRFPSVGGTKSFEGSATFFVVAVACVAVPMVIAGSPGVILIALVTGAALMLVEALSWSGIDNFAIPVFGGLLLRALGAGLGAA